MSFQRKKKPKEKPAASVQVEEVILKESVVLAQEPPGPALRKRKRRPLKAGMETVTSVTSQKVRNISPLRVTKGLISWHFRAPFNQFWDLLKVTRAILNQTQQIYIYIFVTEDQHRISSIIFIHIF